MNVVVSSNAFIQVIFLIIIDTAPNSKSNSRFADGHLKTPADTKMMTFLKSKLFGHVKVCQYGRAIPSSEVI